MKTKLENFLKVLKLRIASTTYVCKQWQIKSFYKYLVYHNINYDNVNKETVEQYLLSLSCSQKAKQQLCFIIGEFFDFMGIENPVKDIVFKKDKSYKLPKIPAQLVIGNIINTLDKGNKILSLRNRLIVELAYGSGLRRLELVKLDIGDIDLEERTVFVNGKGGRNRIVPLTGKAVSSIREYLTKRMSWTGPLLVSSFRRRISVSSVYQVLKWKTGIGPHQFRHAFAGHMLKNGCNIRVIQELLGHKDLKATQIYTQINRKDLRDVVDTRHPRNLQ